MGAEGAAFSPEAETGQLLLYLLVDLLNLTPTLVDSDPDYVHVSQTWKGTCSFDLRSERRKDDVLEGGLDLAEFRRGHVS